MAKDTSKDLAEYQQLYEFLKSNTQTQVLAPIDGEGREFWVHAIADPAEDLEIEIDGVTKSYTRTEALKVLKRKIDELEEKA